MYSPRSTIRVAKTKGLISCAVAAQLICFVVVVFFSHKRFSHDAAHMILAVLWYVKHDINHNFFCLLVLHFCENSALC